MDLYLETAFAIILWSTLDHTWMNCESQVAN